MVIFCCALFALVGLGCIVYAVLTHLKMKKMARGVEVVVTVQRVILHDHTVEGEEPMEGDRYAVVQADFALPDGRSRRSELFSEEPERFHKGDRVACIFVDGRYGGNLYTLEEFRAQPQKFNTVLLVFGLLFLLFPTCFLGAAGYLPFLSAGTWVYLLMMTVALPIFFFSAQTTWSGIRFQCRKKHMKEVEGKITGRRRERFTDRRGRVRDTYRPIISYYDGKPRKHEGHESSRFPKWKVGNAATLYCDEETGQTWMKSEARARILIGLVGVILCGGLAACATIGWLTGVFH